MPDAEQPMRPYALERISELLDQLSEQVERAAEARDEDSIHDLRVSIRRFGRSLRVFSQYAPRKAARKARRQLRRIMALAGEVRNRDIAMTLLRKASIDAPISTIASERDMAVRILVSELARWREDHEGVRWRAALELPSE